MLRIHLWKEWRELRLLLLMISVVLLAVPLGIAWVMPASSATHAPWFAIAVYVGAVVLGTELVGGEVRRGQLDFLARLPRALTSALIAKVFFLVGGVAVIGAVGYLAEILLVVVTGGPWIAFDTNTQGLAVWAVVLSVWLLATSCWWSGLPTVLAVTLIVPSLLVAPLVFFALGLPGVEPVPLVLEGTACYAFGAGLALCWVGFRKRLSEPRGSRRFPMYALAVGLAFVPLHWSGAANIWRFHHVDPHGPTAKILTSFVGPGQRLAFLNLTQGPMQKTSVYYSVVVDLQSRSWWQVGEARSTWMPLSLSAELSVVSSAGAMPALLRGGRSVHPREFVSGYTAEVLATTVGFSSAKILGTSAGLENLADGVLEDVARATSPYRTDRGDLFYLYGGRLFVEEPDGRRQELPWKKGDRPLGTSGRGFVITNGSIGDGRYFDLTRRQTFEFDVESSNPIVRAGAWLSVTRSPAIEGQLPWRLYWPETGAFAPVRGLEIGDKLGPLVDDRRFVVYRKDEPGLWLVDPETGRRTTLRTPVLDGEPISWVGSPVGVGNPVFTPSGSPVIQLNLTHRGTHVGKIVGDELLCTPRAGGWIDVVSCQDEESVIAVVKQRTLERLYFGLPDREVLFPKK